MRKTLTMLAAAPLIAATAAGQAAHSGPTGAAPASSCEGMSVTACDHREPPGSRWDDVLRFTDVQGEVTNLDLGAKGDTPGDMLFFDNQLRSWPGNKPRGRFPSRCTQVTDTHYHCQGTLILAHGTIELATTTDFSGSRGIIASVLGGTGDHVGAAGQVRIAPTDTPGRSRLVVRLSDG